MEAHVFTDGQKSSMPSPFSELAVPPGTKLTVHSVADSSEPNWYVEAVHAPRSVYQPKKVRIQAIVAGSGTEAAETNVSLLLNGKSLETQDESSSIRAAAPPSNSILPDAAYGMNRGEVRIDPRDKLAADDTYPFSIERKEARRILWSTNRIERARPSIIAPPSNRLPTRASRSMRSPSDQAPISISTSMRLSCCPTTSAPVEDYLKARRRCVGRRRFEPRRSRRSCSARRSMTRVMRRAKTSASMPRATSRSHPAVARAGKFDDVKFYQVVAIEPAKVESSRGSPTAHRCWSRRMSGRDEC